MKIIPSPQKGDSEEERTLSEGIQEGIHPYQHEINITEGGEFLDDAIRMKEQPFEETTVKKNE